MKRNSAVLKTLAVFLTLAIGLPGPVFALRQQPAAETAGLEELKAELQGPPAAGAEEIRYGSLSAHQLGQLLDLRKQVGMTDPAAPEKLKRYLESARTYEGVLQKPEEGGIVAVETAVSSEGRLIGCGTVEVFSWVPFEVELKEIAVEPGRQGNGIGSELFGRLLSKVRGIPRLVFVYVTDLSKTGRTGAIARRLGFKEVRPIGSVRSAYPQYMLELNTAGAEEADSAALMILRDLASKVVKKKTSTSASRVLVLSPAVVAQFSGSLSALGKLLGRPEAAGIREALFQDRLYLANANSKWKTLFPGHAFDPHSAAAWKLADQGWAISYLAGPGERIPSAFDRTDVPALISDTDGFERVLLYVIAFSQHQSVIKMFTRAGAAFKQAKSLINLLANPEAVSDPAGKPLSSDWGTEIAPPERLYPVLEKWLKSLPWQKGFPVESLAIRLDPRRRNSSPMVNPSSTDRAASLNVTSNGAVLTLFEFQMKDWGDLVKGVVFAVANSRYLLPDSFGADQPQVQGALRISLSKALTDAFPKRNAYPRKGTAGAEERLAVFDQVRELMEGYPSVSAEDSRVVVVIGKDVAQKFLGLQVLAGLEERVVIDRGDLSDTLTQVVQRGNVVYFYGDSKRGKLLEDLAGRAGLEEISVILRDPSAYSTAWLVLRRILMDLRVPAEAISARLDALAAGLEELGRAA